MESVQSSRQLRVHAPKLQTKRLLTIGIPTVQRSTKNYFPLMLQTMFNKTTENELREIVFVIFLADIGKTTWKSNMESEITSNYSSHVESGSLKVITAPDEYYKSMFQPKNNSYLYWRTKQNYDYAYLMRYCEHLSEYYMQMEDDVTPVENYYAAIIDFVKSQSDDNWVCLEFSALGFIGKLYHSSDIAPLADLLLMFNNTQPVDYIFVYFNILSGKRREMRKPSLFQHKGYFSSLKNKIQPLQDKFFDFPPKQHNGDNPTALSVQTNLKYTDDFPPKLAYSKKPGFFWSAQSVAENSTFTLVFDTTIRLKKLIINTGSESHPSDIARHAIIETSEGTTNPNNCAEFKPLSTFSNGQINVDKDMFLALGKIPVKCLQIRFTKSQAEWLIIREIAVFIDK